MTMPHTGPQAVKVNLDRSTGATVFQTTPARLEWTAQDRIRVIDVHLSGDPAAERVVFDAAPQELTKARYWPGNPSWLTFWSGKTRVRVIPETAMPSPEPWESEAQYNERLAMTAVPTWRWWIERLKGYGVNSKGWTYGRVVGMTFVGVLALAAAIFVIYVLVEGLG